MNTEHDPIPVPHQSPTPRKSWTPEQVAALGVTTDLVTAAQILDIGRTTAYELARRGEFPTPIFKAGRRFIVPVTGLLRLLQIADS